MKVCNVSKTYGLAKFSPDLCPSSVHKFRSICLLQGVLLCKFREQNELLPSRSVRDPVSGYREPFSRAVVDQKSSTDDGNDVLSCKKIMRIIEKSTVSIQLREMSSYGLSLHL